jgi:Caspase domain
VVDDDIPSYTIENEQVTLKIQADCPNDVVTEIQLFQNGKLVGSTRNLIVEDDKPNGEKSLLKVFNVILNNGENRFKAIALNSQRTESQPDEIILNFKSKTTPSVSGGSASDIQLHLVVVGINKYRNPKYNLNYATADATSFQAAIEKGGTGIFSKTNVVFIGDDKATKAGISAELEKIKTNAKPQDVFIFYFAGHGVLNQKKEFYLVPYDVTQLYGQDEALAHKGLIANELQQFSKDIKAQKQLFILDACQSAGAIDQVMASRGAAEEKAISQLARATGTHWLTASGSEQFASEFQQLGHGTFTYVLLEALSGKADLGGDKKITVKELDAYLQEQVPILTEKYKGTPQFPASYGFGNDFPIGVVKN